MCEADFPVVVVDPLRIAGTHCITIGATNFTGAVTATEHLLSLGHRRIGHAGGPASVECSEARLSGYASALRRAGLPLEESLVTHVPFDYEAGMKAGRTCSTWPIPPRPCSRRATRSRSASWRRPAVEVSGCRRT